MLSNSGCTYEGSNPARAKTGTIQMEDLTTAGFNAYLWLLDSDYSFSDWAKGFLVSHATLRDHAHIVDHASVKPGAVQGWTAHFKAGTYGILCVPLRDGSEYGLGYTAGPITVQ